MFLPNSFSALFRNYELSKIDTEKHLSMIIKTVLSRGNWEQILWLFHHYGKDKIKDIFLKDYYGVRELPEPTRKLWGLIFLDKDEQEEEQDRIEKWRCRRNPGKNLF